MAADMITGAELARKKEKRRKEARSREGWKEETKTGPFRMTTRCIPAKDATEGALPDQNSWHLNRKRR